MSPLADQNPMNLDPPGLVFPYHAAVVTQELGRPAEHGIPPRPSGSSTRRPISLFLRLSTPGHLLLLVVGSALIGVLTSLSPLFATAHQVVIVGAVVAVAFFSPRVDLVLALTAYAALCDVLWRAGSARGPYELAKYAAILGFGSIVVRFVRHPKDRLLAGFFVLLLVPGAIVGTLYFGFVGVREYLTSNLGGLIVIALGVLACSGLRLDRDEMRGLYTVALSPIVSMAAHATLATIEAKSLDFSDNSNFAAAGGFGPNQVSAALCFGGLLCVLILLQRRVGWKVRAVALATGVWLVGQAVLTFSRGGVFGLVVALAAVLLASMVESGQRFRSIVLAAVLVVVAVQILSWVGAFTGGESEKRFSSTDSTNRTEIALADLRLFSEDPIFGVGVGVSTYVRPFGIGAIAPHTEYTRMLAEHGIFGVAALCLLVAMCVRIVCRSSGWYRLASVGLLVMAFAQMAVNATRLGSIGIAFAFAAVLEDRT